MRIDEFNALNDVEKEEVVLDNGIFLGSDCIENTMVDIYKLEDFYIQFTYEITKNEKLYIAAFNKPEDMFFFNKMGIITL